MLTHFFHTLTHYTIEIIPSLALGFFLSGLLHEFIPQSLIDRHLREKGIKPLLYITVLGALLPVCCIGALPMAVSFRKRGVPLGSILAFLVATPATSITAIIVMLELMGIAFTLYICAAVIAMGLLVGIIGNLLPHAAYVSEGEACPHCEEKHDDHACCHSESLNEKIMSMLKFGFIDLPKEIGLQIILGLLIAAFVASFTPIHSLIQNYLFGAWGYLFALIFGLLTYVCSTASVPFTHAFINQGLSVGAGMVLLLVGPITSYGTILVIKKEFGLRALSVYLTVISVLSLAFGYFYTLLFR